MKLLTRISRGCRKGKIIFKFILCVIAIQIISVSIDIVDITRRSYNSTGNSFKPRGFGYFLYTNSTRTTTVTPGTTVVPYQVAPDLAPHTAVLANGNMARPWGDASKRNALINKWNTDIEKLMKDGHLKNQCLRDMTRSPLPANHTHCPCFANESVGAVEIELKPQSWELIAQTYQEKGVQPGGERIPTGCIARQKVAIIVPYRDRVNHLHIFINHIHKILTKQNMHYRIFVVEQAYPNIFNKAAMMDIAFLEANKLLDFDCVIFHDVDLLLEDNRNIYACLNMPRHVASSVDKSNYRLAYSSLFGGCTAFLTQTFKTINGYGTRYWGWGGEDDDMYARVTMNKLRPHRQHVSLSRFTMLKHERDHSFPYNIYKTKLVRDRRNFLKISKEEGLKNIKYRVYSIEPRPLFTWIYAEPISAISRFNVQEAICNSKSKGYSKEETVILNCAQKCDKDIKCTLFTFYWDVDWHPWCELHNHHCNSTTVRSGYYIYTKGRTIS